MIDIQLVELIEVLVIEVERHIDGDVFARLADLIGIDYSLSSAMAAQVTCDSNEGGCY
jgi:hypothetical protein